MKKRVKTDSAFLSMIIIMTGFLFVFRNLYPRSPYIDDVLDFVGFLFLLDGIMLRMSARGHKKAHSLKSEKLVMTGPYALVRNPMYLGSFLMGTGFILMVWPWWSLPLFAWLFYARFNKEIVQEEEYLEKLSGDEYRTYCQKVHRLFPSYKQLKKMRAKKIVNMREAFSTKEARGLWTWPLLAVILESFQERIVFEETILSQTLTIFVMAAVVYTVIFWVYYKKH